MVRDSITNSPISNAECEYQGIISATDENGKVKISIGVGEEYHATRYPVWCTIEKAGYTSKSILIKLRKENPETYDVYILPK
jgi:hypothetical protein